MRRLVNNIVALNARDEHAVLSKEDIERRLLGVHPEVIRRFYVEVNGVRFPVKQAFSKVTGSPRSTFRSSDAIRVFRKLVLPLGAESISQWDRLYSALKRLNEFDAREIHRVVSRLVRSRTVTGAS